MGTLPTPLQLYCQRGQVLWTLPLLPQQAMGTVIGGPQVLPPFMVVVVVVVGLQEQERLVQGLLSFPVKLRAVGLAPL